MSNKDDFFNILADLNTSVAFLAKDKDFNPDEDMVETLDDIATELYNQVYNTIK
jgi:hypothetical protein|tara:strand:+ start:720 stop:881 length:162 start_codon:yes stop_codon:yes gene_type:complete